MNIGPFGPMLAAAMSEPWWNMFLYQPKVMIPLGAMVMGVLIVLIASWRRVAEHQADTDLKRTMIERGMSVDEIERVLKAQSPRRS